MPLPSVEIMEAYIRQAAKARGIDPETALLVARNEGLQPGVWQAKGKLDYGQEQSYGPFQLHVSPEGSKYGPGLGNEFIKQTGMDPADPNNWQAGIDFALDNAVQKGWSPWMGAKKAGVFGKLGIGKNAKPLGLSGKVTPPSSLPARTMPTELSPKDAQIYEQLGKFDKLTQPQVVSQAPGMARYGIQPRQGTTIPTNAVSNAAAAGTLKPTTPDAGGIMTMLGGMLSGNQPQLKAPEPVMPNIVNGQPQSNQPLPTQDFGQYGTAQKETDDAEEFLRKLMGY